MADAAQVESNADVAQSPARQINQGYLKNLDDQSNSSSNGVPSEPSKGESHAGWASVFVRVIRSYSEPSDHLIRLVGLASAAAAGSAMPLMSLVFGSSVDSFNSFEAGSESADKLYQSLSRNALYLVYIFIGRYFLVYIHATSFGITGIRATSAFRQDLIKSLLRQDVAFIDSCSSGYVATTISANADLVEHGMAEKIGTLIQSVSMFIAAFAVAFSQQWALTLVTATILPALLIGIYFTFKIDAKIETKILEIYNHAGGLVEEALSTMQIVTAYNAGKRLSQKYDIHLAAAQKLGLKKGPIIGVQYSVGFFTTYCAYSLAWYYGVKLLNRGDINTGGDVIIVLLAVLLATQAVADVAPGFSGFTKALAAARSMFNIIDRQSKIDSLAETGLKPTHPTGAVELHRVTFAYPARPNTKVLQNLSLFFEAEKTTAIVGASGSGKSTIVGLIERWFDPDSGSIHVSGHAAKDLNVRWLRSQIGLVQQEPVLFSDTIYKNVAHGLYGTDMDDLSEAEKRELVRQACIQSNADDFIQALPEGYDTDVGERGGLLSGGQKQRIAIARSVIANPRILLLDEATSALDPTAERKVQAALDNVSKSRTTIMIAHKLATVQKADKIVVLNRGEVVEQGSHHELLAQKGAYFKLVNAQNLDTQKYDGDSVEHSSYDIPGDITPVGSSTEGEFQMSKSNDTSTLEKPRSRRSQSVTIKQSSEEVSKTEEEDVSRKLSLFRCVTTIFKEQRHLWPLYLGGFISSIAGGASFPSQAIMFGRSVPTLQIEPGNGLVSRGNFWALMYFIFSLGVLFSYMGVGYFWMASAFYATRFYRREYLEAMLRQDIGFFDMKGHTAAEMTGRLSLHPQGLQSMLSTNVSAIILVFSNLLGSCILAIAVGWQLGLVVVAAGVPFIFGAGFFRMRLEMANYARVSQTYLESTRFASEAVSAIRTVSSLTLERRIINSYQKRLDSLIELETRHKLVSMFLLAGTESIDLAVSALTFWYGGKLLSEGKYDVATFFTAFMAISIGSRAAGIMFGFTADNSQAHIAANHIIDLRNSQPAINSSTGSTELLKSSGDTTIEFKNVTFSYPNRPDQPVLRNLNMKITRGQSIGIVGASGCGKSTIIALLERFYDLTSGQLLINDTPIQKLDVYAHRARFGLVSQDTTLYQGSIRENILLGITEAEANSLSDSDSSNENDPVVRACKSANIHEFIISLPDGYTTNIGNHGVSLSGGQRQRLAIARALIRKPDVLLFDEATSALDTASEVVVQAAIEEVARQRPDQTVIAVAHRLSTIKRSDRIFVLNRGQVVEEGTHEELIRLGGQYHEMVLAQTLDREVE